MSPIPTRVTALLDDTQPHSIHGTSRLGSQNMNNIRVPTYIFHGWPVAVEDSGDQVQVGFGPFGGESYPPLYFTKDGNPPQEFANVNECRSAHFDTKDGVQSCLLSYVKIHKQREELSTPHLKMTT